MLIHVLHSRLLRIVLPVILFTFTLDHQASGSEIRGGLAAQGALNGPSDEIPEAVRRSLEATIASYERAGSALPAPKAAPVYPFYPQAGILGQDVFLNNFADLDASTNIRDWDCTGYTYDGHRGHDSGIRSFREQAIGVPIFAVLDGKVIDAHDGEADMNTEFRDAPANFVVLDHGGGYYALYWHMKRGSVAVQKNQTVTAGTQIGLTGSSGWSTGPHLHFESWKDGKWFEPSAGRCRSGASFWKSQPPVARKFYVADAYLTSGELSFPTDLAFLLDNVTRASTFVAGFQRVSLRMDFRNLPGGSTWRLRLVDPGGATVVDVPGSWGNSVLLRGGYGTFYVEGTLSTGGWRFVVDVNGATAVDLPFTGVSGSSQVVNRRPNPIQVRLIPAAPATGQIMTCRVQTSLIHEDPDYDTVRYRYVWSVNGRRASRSVTSAALSDVLAKGKVKKGDRVTCSVTPSDGKADGATAVATSN